jgi:hypothetical protein
MSVLTARELRLGVLALALIVDRRADQRLYHQTAERERHQPRDGTGDEVASQ